MSNYLMIAFTVALVLAEAIGLQVDQSKGHFMSASLIHRDSPMSPFYNSSKSPSEILGEAVTRSLDRINYMNSPMHIDAQGMQSVIITRGADYHIKIMSGKTEILAMIMMGAAFSWINCDSSSETNYPLDSYKKVPYDSIDCLISPNTNSFADDGGSENCHYETSYPSKAVSKGVVSQAAFHLDQIDGTKADFRLMFGCSHSASSGLPFKGIIGLGYGDFPFVWQIASQSTGMKEKISYCLPPYHTKDPVKIIFGERATTVTSDEERVKLPFWVKTNSAYYYLTLQSVGYNGKYTSYLTSRHNMVLDFGYSVTTLDEKIFNELVVIVSSVIESKVTDPEKKFEYCYDKEHEDKAKGFEMQFRFDGGTLTLREEDIFANHMENFKCMMIKPTTKNGPMVLASYAQINHLVEFDFTNNQISLVRAKCVEEFGT